MRRCSLPLAIRHCKLETTVRDHSITVRKAKKWGKDYITCDKDVEQMEPSHIVLKNANGTATL